MYESGARIGEILEIRIRDIDIQGSKAVTIYITGNKELDDRENLFVISAPIIKRYIKSGHPSPEDKDANPILGEYLAFSWRKYNLENCSCRTPSSRNTAWGITGHNSWARDRR